jgi:hypothetical protein
LLLLVNAERVGEKMPIAQFRSNNQPEGKIHIASRSFIHPSSSIVPLVVCIQPQQP